MLAGDGRFMIGAGGGTENSDSHSRTRRSTGARVGAATTGAPLDGWLDGDGMTADGSTTLTDGATAATDGEIGDDGDAATGSAVCCDGAIGCDEAATSIAMGID